MAWRLSTPFLYLCKNENATVMIYFPNAKINLGLNIVSKRPDGYHNLETVFYPIGIKDGLEVIEKDGLKSDFFVLEGLKVDGSDDDNLVMKALRLMRQHYIFPFVEIHLLKRIPFGAGIGGGSADASFTLRLLNDMFSLGASNEDLIKLAVQLGADCPFFVYNTPMYAEGIGEQLTKVELSLNGYHLVLVKPDVFVSTKDAFSKVSPLQPVINLREVITKPIEEWKDLMVNDFEKSVFSLHPQIEEIKEKMYSLGAVYASMSGSGASVYGIFKEEVISLSEQFPNCYVWAE